MDLTIAISTHRDYETFLKPTLDMIVNFPNPKQHLYEIIVYGPNRLDCDERIDHFFEEIYQHGNIYGYNYLTWQAKGRNIAYLTDDMVFDHNFFDVVDWLDSAQGQIKVSGFFAGGGQEHSPLGGNDALTERIRIKESSRDAIRNYVKEEYGEEYSLRRIPIARFLAATKKTIDEYMGGYLFHPALLQGGGDQYLGIWAWMNGSPTLEDIPIRMWDRVVASVTEHRDRDAETVSHLIDRLALGFTSYV